MEWRGIRRSGKGAIMSKSIAIGLGLLTAMLMMQPAARAQVTIDISKISCEQFVMRKVPNVDKVVIWLGGFYNGKTGNTILDPQKFDAVTKDVTDYCWQHLNMTLMEAAEARIATKK
jgi:hypothetical protein